MIFQTSHALEFGLKITERDPSNSRVISVRCQFCVFFGHEEVVGSKRIRTVNVKHFSTFRADGYKRHVQSQHAEAWKKYQAIGDKAEKEAFFMNVNMPFASTMHSHMESERPLQFQFNSSIIEVIIGDLLFHPDDVRGVTQSRAMMLFKKAEEADFSYGEVAGRDLYEVVVKTRKRFQLLIKFVACGVSFRAVSRLMTCTREESGMSVYGGCSDALASNYTRIVCAASLQILSDALLQVWAFSLALDGSTHMGKSYLDVRVRFVWLNVLYNFHLLAIPLFDRHTGKNQFHVLTKFLDALLFDHWKHACIGISSNGARNMTGSVQGLVSRLERVCSSDLIRIWCGLHQLDLVMQRVYKPALENEFYSVLTALIGHLRRQQSLIGEMRSTCPKVADTRWASMATTTSWSSMMTLALSKSYPAVIGSGLVRWITIGFPI